MFHMKHVLHVKKYINKAFSVSTVYVGRPEIIHTLDI